MKNIICGDIHGKVNVMLTITQLLANNSYDQVVFVGDFVDGPHSAVCDEIECLKMALELSKNKKAICLYGNHELSYFRRDMRCSGYDTHTQYYMDKNHKIIKHEFKNYTWVGDFLVTHAGLNYDHMLESGSKTFDDYLRCHRKYQYHIGRARYGPNPTGGIFWNDYYMEFKPVPGLKQIFGHTRVLDVDNQYEDNYCIDCLDSQSHVLVVDDYTNHVQILDLELNTGDNFMKS